MQIFRKKVQRAKTLSQKLSEISFYQYLCTAEWNVLFKKNCNLVKVYQSWWAVWPIPNTRKRFCDFFCFNYMLSKVQKSEVSQVLYLFGQIINYSDPVFESFEWIAISLSKSWLKRVFIHFMNQTMLTGLHVWFACSLQRNYEDVSLFNSIFSYSHSIQTATPPPPPPPTKKKSFMRLFSI